MSATFESLQIPNYRKFFAGALVSNVGSWVKNIAQSWLVLTILTDNSSSALGLVAALQFVGVPLFASYGGAVADRFDKRKILLVTQILFACLALTTAVLVYFELAQLWHIFVIATVEGVIAAFDNPARTAFVSEIVPEKMLPNAVGLNSMSFNGARLVGPALAGILISVLGVAPALFLNGIAFFAMFIALIVMNRNEIEHAPRAARKGAVREGLHYVRQHPELIVLMVIVFFLGTFGLNFQLYNALMATVVFNRDAAEYGLLGTVMAIGTFAAALIATRRKRPRLKVVLLSLVAFSFSTILAGFAPSYYAYAFFLIPCGFFALTVMTSCNVAVQMGTEREYRGRVMAIYMTIFLGGTPIGSPLIGWLGDVVGPRAVLIICGGITLAAALGVVVFYMIHDGLRFSFKFEKYLLRLEAVWVYSDDSATFSDTKIIENKKAVLPSED
ncbi:MAG: MFS transporter [Arcanobacterium sp.]|nr:MFS transporter [Arcanobacterium sp.]